MSLYYHVPNPQFRSASGPTSGQVSGLTTNLAVRKKDDSVDLKATLASAFHYCASHSLVLPLPQSEDGNEDFARLGSMLNFDCICLVRVLKKRSWAKVNGLRWVDFGGLENRNRRFAKVDGPGKEPSTSNDRPLSSLAIQFDGSSTYIF